MSSRRKVASPSGGSARRAQRFADRMRSIQKNRSSSTADDNRASLSPQSNRYSTTSSFSRDEDDDDYSDLGVSLEESLMSDTTDPRSNFSSSFGGGSAFTPTTRTIDESAAVASLAPPQLLTPPATTGENVNPPRRHHDRVPGGAAAKLMLLGPKGSDDEDDDDYSELAKPPTLRHVLSIESVSVTEEKLREIDREMQQVKKEFAIGSTENRRYNNTNNNNSNSSNSSSNNNNSNNRNNTNHDNTKDDKANLVVEAGHPSVDGTEADSSLAPSFLNPSEIFHETAAAAVVALLTPRVRESQSTSGYQDDLISAYSNDQHSIVDGSSYMSRDVSHVLLTETTEKRLENLQSRMMSPNKTMTDLLTAIASPEDGRVMDLGYMVRRKNACGALHTLTAQKANQGPICFTLGVLPALTTVLMDCEGASDEQLNQTFPDSRIRNEYVQARNRAIAALMNLAMPKANRIAITHTPNLVQTVISIIIDDDNNGVARRGCCTILAYLGKSPENRLLLAQVPGLLNAVSKVLAPKPVEKKDDSVLIRISTSMGPGLESVGSDDEWHQRREPRKDYDENANELLKTARQNLFALIHHLIKEKDNAYHFARDDQFVKTLVDISRYQGSPSHVLAVKVLANLTRHRLNTKVLVFEKRNVVQALVRATASPTEETREYACYALQNIAQDKSCRQELATTNNLIESLCREARGASNDRERLAATSALKNLCDEPANLIPMTNAPDGVSTLMHLTHEAGVSDVMKYRSCDAISTLSHWLRKIATSGQALDATLQGKAPPEGLFVPSLRVVSWNQWE